MHGTAARIESRGADWLGWHLPGPCRLAAASLLLALSLAFFLPCVLQGCCRAGVCHASSLYSSQYAGRERVRGSSTACTLECMYTLYSTTTVHTQQRTPQPVAVQKIDAVPLHTCARVPPPVARSHCFLLSPSVCVSRPRAKVGMEWPREPSARANPSRQRLAGKAGKKG